MNKLGAVRNDQVSTSSAQGQAASPAGYVVNFVRGTAARGGHLVVGYDSTNSGHRLKTLNERTGDTLTVRLTFISGGRGATVMQRREVQLPLPVVAAGTRVVVLGPTGVRLLDTRA